MTDEVKCPKCGGPMWDQKNGKFPYKPGTPIFKCRNKAECDGVIWEPRTPAGNAKEAAVKRPYSTGPALPGEFDTEEEELRELHAKTQPSKGTIVANQYAATLDWVLKNVTPKLTEADIPVDAAAVNSMIATIMIAAQKAA